MTAVQEPPVTDTGDHGSARVDYALMQVAIEQAALSDSDVSEAELIDELQQLEALTNSLAALRATRMRHFARTHVANQIAAGADEPEKLERSVASQIGMACKISPFTARSRMRIARDLHDGFTHLRALFVAGELSEDTVAAIVTAAGDLSARDRALLDSRLAEHDLTGRGIGRLRDLVRRLVAEIAPEKFRDRAEQAKAERRVTLRPATDGMAYLTAYLPVAQGAACLAALQKAFTNLSCNPAPLTRTRAQVMADTLVERLTGKTTATDVDVDVDVMVPLAALLDQDSPLPAEIPGYGPIPADILASTTGRKTLRRLLTRDGTVIGGDSRRRTFTGPLAEFIRARSRNRCTEPYCDAPVRHIDHVLRAADDGRTEFDNGRGVCEFHNHVREQPGWTVERTPDGFRTTTPTGHQYLGPDPPASEPEREPD
ncbi:HNH endonuclease [Pseudonocardia phyllosphaerae]|uniref:HNH endonuclease n=1 Tax=Pseudonocardia phyllosphaerae TaxID=3390502 RepID=UPI00397AC950